MNDYRTDAVERVFIILDKGGNGLIPIEDLKKVYIAKRHPEVVSGKKSEEQILIEFVETFNLHHQLFSGGRAKSTKASMQEFLEYYEHVSSQIKSDQQFNVVINNSWDLYGDPTSGASLQSSNLKTLGT